MKQMADPWHYPRTALAGQVLNMFETGLSHSLVFFAPRRMGKTEFLRKDILPLAENRGWKAFYFSFLDAGDAAVAAAEFTEALTAFSKKSGSLRKARGLLSAVNKISGEVAGVKASMELQTARDNMKEVMDQLSKHGKILLLMDEVQTLAKDPKNSNFLAALRTSLDIHKDNIKIIFTGSSQEGLRRMFSQANAPFFHFGANLPFPKLDKSFIDHLTKMFVKVTGRKLDSEALWKMFQEMQEIPQLARALVERLALNPSLHMEEVKNQLISEIFNDRAFVETWNQCSELERLLLQKISAGKVSLFSLEIRNQLAEKLGTPDLTTSSIQSAIRSLQRKNLISQLSHRDNYMIDDPNFKNWLSQNKA